MGLIALVVENLFLSSFIFTRRQMDDRSFDSGKKLSKGFEDFYQKHHKNEEISQNFQNILDETNKDWDELYDEIFRVLIDDLKNFGYPGLNPQDLSLAVRSRFDISKILKNHTGVRYKYGSDYELPEAYNGLGFKNLIILFMLD